MNNLALLIVGGLAALALLILILYLVIRYAVGSAIRVLEQQGQASRDVQNAQLTALTQILNRIADKKLG